MDYNRERLRELHEKAAQKAKIDRQIAQLREQKAAAARREFDLRVAMKVEQADVDKLEKLSLSTVWDRLTGRMDEKLETEKAEALAAVVKYEEVQQELAEIEAEIKALLEEQQAVADADRQYDKLFRETLALARNSGDTFGEQVVLLEEKISAAEEFCREIRQAIGAGKGALTTARSVTKSLSSAKKWGTADMLGGGVITTAMKHEHMNAAQADMSTLRSQVQRFRSELSDVRLSVQVNVKLDQFTSFADYFFDGLLVDGYVQSGINRSQNQVSQIQSQISSAVSRLERMEYDAERELKKRKEELKNLLLEDGK